MKIEGKNLSYRYPNEEKAVFQNLSFVCDDAQPLVLMGASGIGKTTLVKIICGLLKPDEGELLFDGRVITQSREWPRMSVVFQEDRLIESFTALENWQLVMDEKNTRLIRLAESLGLEAADMNHYPDELSGGQRRRVAIGRALLFESDALILDEPFQGLDQETRERVTEVILKEAGAGGRESETLGKSKPRNIILVTHDREDAERFGGKILEI